MIKKQRAMHARTKSRKPAAAPARRHRKPTWGIHAHYSRVTPARRREWKILRLTLRPGLERDTQLMPWLVADTICTEAAGFLDTAIPERYSDWLDAKAERCYAKSAHFRQLMRRSGNEAREWLYAFMRHWLAALLGTERPDLLKLLPKEYMIGHPLPRSPVASPPRRRAKPWNPRRVLDHPRWKLLEDHSSPRSRKLPLWEQ